MVWLKPVIFLFCISLSYLTVQARAESTAAEPRAQYIFPVGGQQGSTLEVRIEGEKRWPTPMPCGRTARRCRSV